MFPLPSCPSKYQRNLLRMSAGGMKSASKTTAYFALGFMKLVALLRAPPLKPDLSFLWTNLTVGPSVLRFSSFIISMVSSLESSAMMTS